MFRAIPWDERRADAYRVWLGRADDLHQDFRVVENEELAWTPVRTPPEASRVALLTTAGVHLEDDRPFDELSEHGDPSFRAVPGNAPASALAISHAHYDHSDADQDANCVFPVDRLREFVAAGRLGSVGAWHYSFMGFNPNPARLIEQGAEVVRRLRDDDINVAVMTPG